MSFSEEKLRRLLKSTRYKNIDSKKLRVFQKTHCCYIIEYRKGMFKVERHPLFFFKEKNIMPGIKAKLDIIERGLRTLKGIKY